jgi:hypothetical protein
MIDLKKIAEVRDGIDNVRGPLVFFALFLPEDTDQWDVVVAGPNIRENNFAHLQEISAEVVRVLGPEGMRDVRSIVVFEGDFEPLQPLLQKDLDADEPLLMTDFVFSRLPITRAYIFTARPVQLLMAAR